MDLRDKVVVITGASRGLGAALAELFSREGCKVVVSATTKDKLDEIASRIKGYAVQADVKEEAQVIHLADQAVKKFGRIDIWINNAGIWIPRKPITDTDWKAAHNVFEVNFFGTVYGSKEALLRMMKNRSGAIVNIISTSALDTRAGLPAYQASKWAVRGFTGSLRNEAAPFGVIVVGVYPGGMQTLMYWDTKPPDYSTWMDPAVVAQKIVNNLKLDKPEEEQIIRRPAVT